MKRNISTSALVFLSAALLSLPFLVPGTGFLSLVGFVPLLFAEDAASKNGTKRFFLWHYTCFVLWNAASTFWVCNATVGGGIFAVLANALQMSAVFGLFRWTKKRLSNPLPYFFLAFAWIAWEHYYLHWAQISWPWLVLGNSFARTTNWIQWYEYTGTLGGSLWIWVMNLGIFTVLKALAEGSWKRWNPKAKTASLAGLGLLLAGPLVLSAALMPENCRDGSVRQENSADIPDGAESLEVMIAQPNIDPYNKFGGMSQQEQDRLLLSQFSGIPEDRPVLLIGPETFTGDFVINDPKQSPTVSAFTSFLKQHPNASVLLGASSREYIPAAPYARPSNTARYLRDNIWLETHNSAFMLDSCGTPEIYHKSKLVVGVELMPYPALMRHLDGLLGGVMGHCVGQKEITDLTFNEYDSTGAKTASVPVGCAICYESVYGEHCAEYVRKGARLLTVITNDAWWKDTPGYRQHLSYSSLRAIETRRWVARCANTGISAVIDPSGQIRESTSWWKPEVIRARVGLEDGETFYVSHGDFAGRLSVLMSILLLVRAIVRRLTGV